MALTGVAMAAAWPSLHLVLLYTKTHTKAVCSPDKIDACHESNQEQQDRLATVSSNAARHAFWMILMHGTQNCFLIGFWWFSS